MKISAVVLTKNEEKNIERCLKSLEFVDEIIIVDDYSTDKTLEIVHKVLKVHKVYKVFQRKLDGDFAGQRNFGMDRASNDWILFVDADEEVTPELKIEIMRLDTLRVVEAYFVPRRDFFWGKELKYGEVRRIRLIGLIRLMRKDSGQWQGKVHEEFKVKNQKSKVKTLDSYLNHYPHQTLKEFIRDINYYSTLRAKELFNRGKKTNVFEIIVWPIGKFVNNYFLNLGFLDGPAGFIYAFLMSFHSFLVRAKLWQYYSI